MPKTDTEQKTEAMQDPQSFADFTQAVIRANSQILSDGTVDGIIRQKLTEAYTRAIDNSCNFGPVRDAISQKINDLIVPAIEGHNFSKYLVKLDKLLADIVNETAFPEYRKLLGNFASVMKTDIPRTVTLDDILEHYAKFCADNINNDGRGTDPESWPRKYGDIEVAVSLEVDENMPRYYCNDRYGMLYCLVGEAESDENRAKLARRIPVRIYDWESKKEGWGIRADFDYTVRDLRFMDAFDVWLLSLSQAGTRILCDEEGGSVSTEVAPTETPDEG